MGTFIDGAALFVSHLGVPIELAQAFIALVAVSFALTSMDSGTRLLRYNIEEIAGSVGLPQLGQRYVAATIAVALIGFFAFYEISGQPAGLAFVESIWKHQPGAGGADAVDHHHSTCASEARTTGTRFSPWVFMLTVTIIAMVLDLQKYWTGGNLLLTFVAASIFRAQHLAGGRGLLAIPEGYGGSRDRGGGGLSSRSMLS